jgi:hypothetical protein
MSWYNSGSWHTTQNIWTWDTGSGTYLAVQNVWIYSTVDSTWHQCYAISTVLAYIGVSVDNYNIYDGGTAQCTATGYNSGYSPISCTVNWTCNSTQGGTVDSTGLFTAGEGSNETVTVTATDAVGGIIYGTVTIYVI